ncbi:MAG: cytochrome C [Chloroflexi bacterium 44-23]|nr:MAG: cytochrome C [Chloroflexi bacterium 44-23]
MKIFLKILVIIVAFVAVIAVVILLLQFIPYGKNHVNPPVVKEPTWDSPTTRILAQRACFDCHSNETTWPWYSNIAPMSWLIQKDVDEGRQKLNFSEWQRAASFDDLDEIGEVIREGEMPPFVYYPMHPEARLNEAEKQALISGLENTVR